MNRSRLRLLGILCVAGVLIALLLVGLSALQNSRGVAISDGLRVRFVSDDRDGAPTLAILEAPSEPARAIVEQRRYDGNVLRLAEFELGEIEPGDRVHVRWEPAPDSTDPRRPFRIILEHDGVLQEGAIPNPFPDLDELVLPVNEHPVEADGAIVIAYTRSWSAPDGDFDEVSPLYLSYRLVVRFDSI